MSYTNIKVKSNTRFILCIDEDCEYVYLKDLCTDIERINATECANILDESLSEVKFVVDLIENKMNKNKRLKNLKVIK